VWITSRTLKPCQEIERLLSLLGQFLANFSVLTSYVELRRVLLLLSQRIDNRLDMQLIATHGNRPKHRRFQLIIAWSGVQIPLGPPYLPRWNHDGR
jgi:hypothetical protein